MPLSFYYQIRQGPQSRTNFMKLPFLFFRDSVLQPVSPRLVTNKEDISRGSAGNLHRLTMVRPLKNDSLMGQS